MKLSEIKRAIIALEQERDTETAHDEADKLLIETCRALLNEDEKITLLRKNTLVEQIIEAYNKLEKWYA